MNEWVMTHKARKGDIQMKETDDEHQTHQSHVWFGMNKSNFDTFEIEAINDEYEGCVLK